MRRTLAAAVSIVLVTPLWAGERVLFTPANHDAVLARVERGAPVVCLVATPHNSAEAVIAARALLERYRITGQLRDAGAALSLIEPWASRSDAAPDALLLRGIVRQCIHDFAGALADFDATLRADPGNRQALLSKAMVHQVRGEWSQARAASAGLAIGGLDLAAVTSTASLAGLTGSATSALALLDDAISRGQGSDPQILAWTHATRGELLARLGDRKRAAESYREAIRLCPSDVQSRIAIADLELESGEPLAVIAVLDGAASTDGVTLRRLLAEKATAHPGWERRAREFVDAGRHARVGGESVHLREQARAQLELLGDARGALELATLNWNVQHEPADARLLAAAAIASGDNECLARVADWQREARLEDVALTRLLAGVTEP